MEKRSGIYLILALTFILILRVADGTGEEGACDDGCRVLPRVEKFCSFTSTEVTDTEWKSLLLGSHRLSLQWIGSEKPGTVSVIEDKGLLYISGSQEDKTTGDYLRLKGLVRRAGVREFIFCGIIMTRVSYINGGEECVRRGSFKFAVRGARKYWRMQDKANPCDETEQGPIVDYIDIYLR